jgi:hypothetical protein
MRSRTPIRPELLAGKLAAIRNYEHPQALEQISERPRLVEMLWFIQFVSMQPGGLVRFCENMFTRVPHRFGPPSLRAAKPGNLSPREKIQIFSELPIKSDGLFRPRDTEDDLRYLARLIVEENAGGERKTTDDDHAIMARAVKDWTFESLKENCFDAARSVLPEYLYDLCTDKTLDFKNSKYSSRREALWFVDDAVEAVMEMMDLQAQQVEKRLAMTEVAKLVFDRLDYALAEKVMVRIEGGSRFGKTEALSAWVEMRPGLARLVRVPCDNSMGSLFKRIGEALGIDCSYGSNMSRLKERVEYVIQHGGLFLVFDEAHFLAPLNFSETTPPHRLNWIRTEIVDRGLPLAVAMTPQSFKGAIDRYVKKTRYDMTQFFGRDFLPCMLPDVLTEQDMIAVARIHFPEMSENALGYIANEARLSENYLQAVEAVARRARYLAGRRGGVVRLNDLKTAVAEVLVRTDAQAQSDPAPALFEEVSPEPAGRGSQGSFKRVLTPPERGIKPTPNEVELDILNNRSLRSAGGRRVNAEPVSVEA